jgi:hypothetical protein
MIKIKIKRRSCEMKKEEKKGLFGRIFSNKEKKSCCCNLEIEEISEENKGDKKGKEEVKDKRKPCC